MDFHSIQRLKQFFLEGKEENARLCYTNTERFGEEDEDSFDDWSSSLETARKILQISKKWEQQEYNNFPSDNSSNEEDNLAAKQVMVCFSEDVSLKMRNQKMWQSAISKLESYGFYESHCVQALICTDGDLENALEMLFYKYYNIKDILKIEDFEIPSATELLKIRQEEKQELENIFYDAFLEKIENRIWIVQLQLRYLISSIPIPEKNSYFILEIRFPEECIYPYEPPYIYFYKNKGTFPRIKCLRIVRRLHDEALLYSLEGIPSIHSIISLLKNENEIQAHLEKNREPFLHPFETLYEIRREERKTEDEYMREFEIIMRDMTEQEEERMVNRKSLYAREQRTEEEINCNLLEPLLTKEREKNENKEEEKREDANMLNSHAVELYTEKPAEQEGSMINRHVLESEKLEKREENLVNSNIPSYAEEPEKREGNMSFFHAIGSLYTGESMINHVLEPSGQPEEKEEDIINPNIPMLDIEDIINPNIPLEYIEDMLNLFNSPLYEWGTQKKEENVVNSNILPSYADKSKKREGNTFNSHEVIPPYAGEPEKWAENMFSPNVLVSQYTTREKQEGSIVNSLYSYILEPLYAGEGNMINFNVLMSLNGENLERREENMFNPHVVEPLYVRGPEKLKESTANPFIPLYVRVSEKEEGNIANPNVLALSYAGESEKIEGNVLNSHESLSNDFSVTNSHKFNSIKEYKDYITLDINEKNNLIKEVFLAKKKDPKYIEMQEVRQKLPVWSQKDNILKAVCKNQVVIISGETGCGKSTQIPQFILDDWIVRTQYGDESHINIICTQPRKISTIILAERVAAERIEKVGDVVGYQVRLEKKLSSRTRLTFCTVGILLQKSMRDASLMNATHIIVDEVHERNAESDFLLMLLKDLLPKRPSLRIILMSATLNLDVFSSYFGHVPVLSIPGRSFLVEQIFLQDVLEKTGYILNKDSKYICKQKSTKYKLSHTHADLDIVIEGSFTDGCIPEESVMDEDLTVLQLINRYPYYSKQTYINLYFMDHNKINYDLIECILEWIITGEHDYPKKGSILIFLPGLSEIIMLMDQLDGNFNLSKKIMIVPLHSSFSNEEQSRVFQKIPNDVCKIVISTNLAETSITINDCVFVIDSGRMRESRFNLDKNMQCLETCWVTQANVTQRKGRAGRIMPGVCIHLYTSHSYKHFAARQIPEILRISLESLLLYSKLIYGGWKGDLYTITEKMLDSPSPREVTGAIKRLQDVGAFDSQCELTSLGHHLAKLPVNVRIGKLILFGAIFSCLDSVLTIAACLSYKSPFSIPFDMKNKVGPKLKFFVACSDHLTILQAYREWQEIVYYHGKNAGIKFARENFLSIHTLYTLADMKYQFLELLVSIGFVSINLPKRQRNIDNILMITGNELNKNNSNCKLLQGLICAALYPNIVKQTRFSCPHIVYETRNDGFVKIHPSSVNSQINFFSSPFLAYQQKLKTNERNSSQVFIMEVSMIPILALILFSSYEGNIEVQYNSSPDNCVISLDHNWITITVDWNMGYLLQRMRTNLAMLLMQKMENPQLDLLKDPEGKQIIDMIIHAVTNW